MHGTPELPPHSPSPEASAPAPAPAVAPVTRTERLSSLDMLRGTAVLGILLLNIVMFGLPSQAYTNPQAAGGATGPNLVVWLVNQVLFEGKMRAIFSMLFGAGACLFIARGAARGAGLDIADAYYRRTLWLIAFGLVHGYLVWDGDILFSYGVFGLVLFPFRTQSPRFLLTAGLVLAVLVIPANIFHSRGLRALHERVTAAEAAAARGQALSEEQTKDKKEWEGLRHEFQPDARAIDKELTAHRGGYLTVLAYRAGRVTANTKFLYRFGVFDIAGMMLFGMGLMKMGALSATRSRRFYLGLIAAGYGIGLPINAWMAKWRLDHQFDPAEVILSYAPYGVGRLSMALGHIGLLMLLYRSDAFGFVSRRLAAVGQMAFTNYLGQSILCTLLFNGYGFGLYGRLERHQLYYVVAAVWALQLIVSPLWLARFQFGPFEWLWRSLTYWKLAPIRLRAPGLQGGTTPSPLAEQSSSSLVPPHADRAGWSGSASQ